jgi:RNA polymerase sigma factor (sigma-70 family)
LSLAGQDQPHCATCPQKPAAAATRTIPGTSESVPVGRIENLMPIAVLAALGCDNRARAQGHRGHAEARLLQAEIRPGRGRPPGRTAGRGAESSGGEDYAGALFTADHDRICRYIASMVRGAAEAEDLTRETFPRARCRRQMLRDPNAVVSHRHPRLGGPAAAARAAGGWKMREQPAASPPSAQEEVERAGTSACVQRCLDFLSDSYRAVLLLHEAHGLTAAEIPEILGVSVEKVRIRLYRARRQLGKSWRSGCTISGKSSGVPCCAPKRRA